MQFSTVKIDPLWWNSKVFQAVFASHLVPPGCLIRNLKSRQNSLLCTSDGLHFDSEKTWSDYHGILPPPSPRQTPTLSPRTRSYRWLTFDWRALIFWDVFILWGLKVSYRVGTSSYWQYTNCFRKVNSAVEPMMVALSTIFHFFRILFWLAVYHNFF